MHFTAVEEKSSDQHLPFACDFSEKQENIIVRNA